MNKVNIDDIEEIHWRSPKGVFESYDKEVSQALGRDPSSTDIALRHPFDVEITRLAAGTRLCPYHLHSAQWEYYQILSGSGLARDADGVHDIVAGDAFIFKPGEAHQIINNSTQDLVYIVVADNPFGESCYYPDSQKWGVGSPERRLIRSDGLDYYDGEE